MDGLDLDGRDGFPQFSRERRRPANLVRVEIACELLRQRRTPLAFAAEGVEKGRGRAPEVEPVVVIKAMILGGDQRIDHVR